MVEHAAVNRRVVGSSPTRGAKTIRKALTHIALAPFMLDVVQVSVQVFARTVTLVAAHGRVESRLDHAHPPFRSGLG